MLVSYINLNSDSSSAKVVITSPALVVPDGILDHVVVERVNKHKSHTMMIEAWINRRIKYSTKCIIGMKEIYGKSIK